MDFDTKPKLDSAVNRSTQTVTKSGELQNDGKPILADAIDASRSLITHDDKEAKREKEKKARSCPPMFREVFKRIDGRYSFKPDDMKKLYAATLNVPIVTNKALASQNVQACAVEGKRIEIAEESLKYDKKLMQHELLHFMQQKLYNLFGDIGSVSEEEAEKEADGLRKIFPCSVNVLYRKNNNSEAIKYNNGLHLPVDFILRTKVELSDMYPEFNIMIDYSNLDNAIKFDDATINAIRQFQRDNIKSSEEGNAKNNGKIDAETRAVIEKILLKEEGFDCLIGKHYHYNREKEEDNIIVKDVHDARDGSISPVNESTYLRCKKIIETWGNTALENKNGGFFNTKPGAINILAIRGARIKNNMVMRTDGAENFYKHVIEPTKRGENVSLSSDPKIAVFQRYFFSSYQGIVFNNDNGNVANTDKKGNMMKEKMPKEDAFDDVFLNIWRTERKGQSQFFVQARHGSVDPGDHYHTLGTAHLRDGQYEYRKDSHSTKIPKHKNAILSYCKQHSLAYKDISLKIQSNALKNYFAEDNSITFDSSGWHRINETSIRKIIFKGDESYIVLGSKRYGIDWINYSALTKKSNTEVIRDKGKDGILQLNEIENSIEGINNRNANFVDIAGIIGINIHSSPDDKTSSEGCQNIPIDEYARSDSSKSSFNRECKNSLKGESICYTLLDSSKICKDSTENLENDNGDGND